MAVSIISTHPRDLTTLCGRELLASIEAAQGRTVVCEIVAFRPPLIDGTSNPALAASLGADIIHLNHYDVSKPLIAGHSSTAEGTQAWGDCGVRVDCGEEVDPPVRQMLTDLGMGVTIDDVRRGIGRVVGVTLELTSDNSRYPLGRQATPDTSVAALQQGAAYLSLVAAPSIPTAALLADVRALRSALGSEVVLIAGRMPWGGGIPNGCAFLVAPEIEALIDAGADVIMLPVPGTVPGARGRAITDLVTLAHGGGALVAAVINASQESAAVDTVRRLALDAKLTGADMFQIGDGGYSGIAIPENILAFATAIKGRRHTYRRMAT